MRLRRGVKSRWGEGRTRAAAGPLVVPVACPIGQSSGHLTITSGRPDTRSELRLSSSRQRRQRVGVLQARHQARAQHKDEIIAALTADKLDTDKLYQLADQHAAEIQAITKDVMPDIQKVHDVLTPAQLQTLAAKARAHHAHP